MTFFKSYFSGWDKPGGFRDLLILALPMIISTACDGVMTFTDRLFLARLGSEQMNAALGGGVTMQTLMFFFMGLTGYSTAMVAQYYGANKLQTAPRVTFQTLLVSLLAWPIILLLKPIALDFFKTAEIPASQLGYQTDYLNWLVWGSVFSLLRYTLGCYFTGIGKTRIVMYATIAAMLTNVGLDYLLIFGKAGFPMMGIKGAALATITGSVVATLILAVAYLSSFNRRVYHVLQSFHFDWKLSKKLLYYGSPAGLEMFLNFLAFFFMTMIFQSQGEVESTAITIMFNWDLVSFIPLLGIEVAVTSLVGRYMGAAQPDLAHTSALTAIKTGMFYSVVILLLFLIIPETLTRVFRPMEYSAIFEEAVPMSVQLIRIAALYVLAESIMVALIGALRGAGDTYFTMFASVAAHWTFLPVIYLSLKVWGFSLPMSWFLLVLVFLMFCGLIVWRFRSGRWRKRTEELIG